MLEKIMNNWAWKLLSLVLAIVLWLAVVNYDDPYITKSFEDIPVEKRNSEAITSQEKAITYLEGETIDVVVGGNRSRVDRLKLEDVSAYVDMKKVSITGAIDIEVDVAENISVLEKTPNNMQIDLEDIDTVLKDVEVFYIGQLDEEYIKLTPTLTPSQVELRGPESKLALVSSVIVKVKLDEAVNDITVFASPKMQDQDGNDVAGLEMNKNQVQIQIPIQKTKTVPLRFATVGEVGPEYRLMSISIETDEIVVRGEGDLVDNLDGVLVSDVDLTTLNDEVKNINIDITSYLPEGILLHDVDSMTNIKVDIRPIVSTEFVITAEDVGFRYLDEQMQFKFLEELSIPVTVRGIQADLNSLELSDLNPTISLRNLEPGEHEVELELTVNSKFEVISELPKILVELTEITEDTKEAPEAGESNSDSSSTSTGDGG